MERWGLLIGYVVLFACFHLVLYYVYVHRTPEESPLSESRTSPNADRRANAPEPPPFSRRDRPPIGPGGGGPERRAEIEALEESLEFDGETIRCPNCRARNRADPTYTYCWNCIATLQR